jgi:hypothetical protein
LSSAFAVVCGRYGDVTRHARQSDRSRQAVYRESAGVVEGLQGDKVRACIAALRQQLADLAARARELEGRLSRAVELPPGRLDQFAATAQAEGVSLPVARRLLAVLLPGRAPSVAALGRASHGAAVRAGRLLAVFDEAARPRVAEAAADEIFFGRRPALMVVEPGSLCWLTGRLVECRDGESWAQELGRYGALEYLVSDAGDALAKGVRLVRRQRPGLLHGLDLFHTCREAGVALGRLYRSAARAVGRADRAQQALDRRGGRGLSRAGKAGAVAKQWRQAERLLDGAADAERAWQECRAALDWLTPEGGLNDRGGAAAALGRALPRLKGPAWDKARRLLLRPEALTFLDQMHRGLGRLGLAGPTQAALVTLEAFRRHPERLRGDGPEAAAARGLALARSVQLAKAEPGRPELAGRLRGALRRAWRASSLVEGVNSVARMQQARHRKMTQGLLDLKRLYWNLRPFRTGRRKGQTPYGLLGLKLPPGGWWDLLQRDPDQLRQELSAQADAA